MTRKYFHDWEPYWFCFASNGDGGDPPDPGSPPADPSGAGGDGAGAADPVPPSAGGGDGGSADSSPKPPPAPSGAKPPAKADWKDKRIAQLTAQLAQARTTTPSPATPTPSGTGLTEADVDRLANERAATLAAINDFNNRCNETQREGRAQFQDFDSRVAAMQRLVDPNNVAETNSFNMLLDAAMQTGQGAALIHELGGDLDEAQRLMGLSPVKLGVELAKRASKLEQSSNNDVDPPVGDSSGVPAPLRARVNARGPSHERIEPDNPDRESSLSTDEWMRRRSAQVAERSKTIMGLR